MNVSKTLKQQQKINKKLDYATIGGLFFGFGLVGAAIVISGSFVNFLNVPSFLIVIGGTFAATTICFSLQEIMRAQTALWETLFNVTRDPNKAAYKILDFAKTARSKGNLALENTLSTVSQERILNQGIQLLVDGNSPDNISRILHQEAAAIESWHHKSVQVLQKSAEYSPAFGLIGTLVGLVQMLANLQSPESIGPSMAVAILTTFYGAILANLVFSPLAAKLSRNSQEESLVNRLYILGIYSIAKQENPRQLEIQLNSVLPPEKRINYFEPNVKGMKKESK
jgi:chemotaxis protein MotA